MRETTALVASSVSSSSSSLDGLKSSTKGSSHLTSVGIRLSMRLLKLLLANSLWLAASLLARLDNSPDILLVSFSCFFFAIIETASAVQIIDVFKRSQAIQESAKFIWIVLLSC